MSKCFRRSLLLLGCGFCCCLRAGAAPAAVSPTALPELVRVLEEKSLLPVLSGSSDALLIQQLLSLLGIPAVPLPLSIAAEEHSPICLPGDAGEVFLRLADFRQLDQEGWENCLKLLPKEKWRGVILDLRGSKGFQESVAEFYQQQLLSLALPIMILIDGETAGAPELLAANLRQGGKALLLGQKSTGIRGAGQEISLATGMRFRCPAEAAGEFTGPVVPDVELSGSDAYQRWPYVPPLSDPWCRHAAGTLTMILTLAE